jgi:hypothetical protein
MSKIYHTIIGLTSSGKTTYLAALWHLLDAGEVATKLVLDKLVGDHKHLNTIVEAWRRCEKAKRTSIAAEATVAVHVHEPATGQKIVLDFPDLSGESFERQITTRKANRAYVDGYDHEGGIMLFVNADRALDGLTILEVNSMSGKAPKLNEEPKPIEWAPKYIPEQVQLVELLQFTRRPPFTRRKRRIAVVISAWDVLGRTKLTPQLWLSRELPLLHQYLISNSESFEQNVYGISAQGGDVTTGARAGLLEKIPSERIRCVCGGSESHDLTEPLIWLSTTT